LRQPQRIVSLTLMSALPHSSLPPRTRVQNSRRRLLVVDDDKPVRGLFDRMLTRAGFQVDFAVDGEEALDRLANGDYAVIVLDLMMPRLGGLELLERIRGIEPRMLRRIIIASGADTRTIGRAGDFGVHAVVRKPFDIDEFVDAARSCASQS
jgi:CheY-like chemotaxis protein